MDNVSRKAKKRHAVWARGGHLQDGFLSGGQQLGALLAKGRDGVGECDVQPAEKPGRVSWHTMPTLIHS